MISTDTLLRLSEARALDPLTPLVARVVDACIDAARAAAVCSDACAPLADAFRLEACVHRTRAVSDVCWATAISLLRADGDRDTLRALVCACRAACAASAGVCIPHAQHHEFCRVCGRACEEAVAACGELLAHWAAETLTPPRAGSVPR